MNRIRSRGTSALGVGHPQRKIRDARQAASPPWVRWRHLAAMAKTCIGGEPPVGYGDVTATGSDGDFVNSRANGAWSRRPSVYTADPHGGPS